MVSSYQIGGSLQLNAPTYVTRKADGELYEGLKSGEFCYVLNCRQMGKSSLRVRAMARLQAEGVACVAVQMTDIIDEEITPEQFYAGVIDSITADLDLDAEGDFDNMAWWVANRELSLVNRFSKFLETVLLSRVTGSLVIFIDEIDRVLSLPFRVNGFFSAIRECFNKRADNPNFRRLTFALLGVATPSDLIEDKTSTPFNIGRAIDLTGFTLDEAKPLERGLVAFEDSKEVLKSILVWTRGQPFLSQKICLIAAQEHEKSSPNKNISEWIDDLVNQRIIQNWQSNDEPEHLRTIRDRLLRDDQKAARRLDLYQRVLSQQGFPIRTVDSLSREYIELRLSGVVVNRDNELHVYSPIVTVPGSD
ncbi:MAG: AAA-like domain-containing protein [Phormidesmis sp.]